MRTIAQALGNKEQASILSKQDASTQEATLALMALQPFVLLIDDADALATRDELYKERGLTSVF